MIRWLLWALFLIFPALFSLHAYVLSASAADYSNGVHGVTLNDRSSSGNGGAVYVFGRMDNGVINSNFSGNRSTRWGGALYIGELHGGIHNSFFTGNTSARGGAMQITDLYGGISGSSFINNTSSGFGGAVSVDTSFSGNLSNSLFAGNSADTGGGLYSATFHGNIEGSRFDNNRARSGAGLYVRLYYGNIRNSTFTGNAATDNGGAATLDAMDTGMGIYDSLFQGNSAGNAGGAIISFSLDGTIISNSRFFDNRAGRGGALFLATDRTSLLGSPTMDVTLHADAGKETSFSGNRDSGGANSLYFGRYAPGANSLMSAGLTISGAGRVELYDPIRVSINNDHSFTFNQDMSGGNLIWGGANLISTAGSGTATFNFNQGNTTLLSNYTLQGQAGTDMRVSLATAHTLTLDLTDRDGTLPFLDFTRTGIPGSLTSFSGTRVTALRSLLATEGRYLLVDGYDQGAGSFDPNDISFIPVPGSRFLLDDSIANQLWLVFAFIPDASPDTYRPNVQRALRALDQMIRHSDYGLNMTDAEFDAFKADIDSTTPEAAVTMGLIGMQVHEAVSGTALRTAFNAPAGRFQATAASDGLQSIVSRAAFIPRMQSAFIKGGDERKRWPESVAEALQRNPGAALGIGWTPAAEDTREVLLASLHREKYGLALSDAGGLPYAGSTNSYSPYGLNFWVGYLGNFVSAESHDGYFGYDSTTNGALVGLTWNISEQWTAGLYSGYSKTDADWKGISAEGEADGFHLGLFGRYSHPSGFSLTADGAYSYFDTSIQRTPARADRTNGSFDQHVYSLGLEAAYTFSPWESGRLTPYVGVRQTWARQDAFTEDQGMLAARVGSAETSSFVTTLGAALAHDFLIGDRAAITPALEVAWSHEYGDRHVKTFGNTFTAPMVTGEASFAYDTYSLPRDRDMYKAGASLQALIVGDSGRIVSFKAAYSMDMSDNYTGHTVFAGLEFDF